MSSHLHYTKGTALKSLRITDRTTICKLSYNLFLCGPSDLSIQADLAFCLWGLPAALNLFVAGEFLCLLAFRTSWYYCLFIQWLFIFRC